MEPRRVQTRSALCADAAAGTPTAAAERPSGAWALGAMRGIAPGALGMALAVLALAVGPSGIVTATLAGRLERDARARRTLLVAMAAIAPPAAAAFAAVGSREF